MMISSKGRYTLRVLVDLAENGGENFTPLKNVAERQGLSLKYTENLMNNLSKNKFVDGVQGKGGGYRLNRLPEEYRVGDILRLTEGTLAPVACLKCDAEACNRQMECRTRNMWETLDGMITGYLDSVTLADLMKA